jgi:hypothetical protein
VVIVHEHATIPTEAPTVAGIILNAPPTESFTLAKKPNYNFEKNRREQDRKKKKEEKRLRRLENSRGHAEEPVGDEPDPNAPPPAE